MDRIRVIYEQDEDTWVATSPEVPDRTVVADGYERARQLAEDGVRLALDRDEPEIKHFVPPPPHRRAGRRCPAPLLPASRCPPRTSGVARADARSKP